MKKNKILYRCYIGGYFLWVFGAILCPLLLIRFSNILALIVFIISLIALGLEITSHVYYNTNRELYPLFSFISHGISALYVFAAFVIEMVLTAMGEGALYAQIISPIALAFYGLLAFFLVKGNMKIMKELEEESLDDE